MRRVTAAIFCALPVLAVVLAWCGWPRPAADPGMAPLRAFPELAEPVAALAAVSDAAPAQAVPARVEVVSPPSPMVPGSLRVRVRHAADGRAIAGVSCALRSREGDRVQRREATTGVDGDVVFADLRPAAVEVRLDELDRRTVRIEPGREAEVEFALAQFGLAPGERLDLGELIWR